MGDERFLFYGWSHILISGVRAYVVDFRSTIPAKMTRIIGFGPISPVQSGFHCIAVLGEIMVYENPMMFQL